MVDLGKSPLCESFLPADRVEEMEPFYPLHVRVCTTCWLAQLPAFVAPDEIFTEYAYFSAYSDSWVEHSRRYVDMITDRLDLGSESLVVEVASNDGYLLQHFVPKGIPVLGIDPAANVATAAEARGVPTLVEFFGVELAKRLAAEGRRADLVLGANVLAQVPDINDFVGGVALLLAPGGTTTFEFPHLARLLEGLQYDTVYHEHFSYFSLASISAIFGAHGLDVVDVEELPSHGGSLRVYGAHYVRRTRAVACRRGAAGAGGGGGAPRPGPVCAVRRGCRGVEARAARAADRASARRQARRRLRRARQGEHAAQLLRHPHGFPRLHRRPESVQARPVHTGHAHPDRAAGPDRRDASRRDRDPAVEPRAGDRRPTCVHE